MIDLLKEIVEFKTYLSEEKEKCAKWIINKAKELGLEAEIVYGKVPNVLVWKEGKGKKICFVTHYDVVPPGEGWTKDPFKLTIEDGKAYGRGTADNKGALIACLKALADTEELNINPVIAIAGGEETQESDDFFNQINCDVAIVVDSGSVEEISIGASGVLGINIKIFGKQCHSAYPYLGRNPIFDLRKILDAIYCLSKILESFKSKYPGGIYKNVPVRLNPTILNAGIKKNIIPPNVNIYLNIRTVPEYPNDFIFNLVKEFLEKIAKENNIGILIERDELELEPWISEGEHVKKFKEIVKEVLNKEPEVKIDLGATDGIHFFRRGIKVIQYGPIREENNIHGPDEFVYLKDLEILYNVIKNVLIKGC